MDVDVGVGMSILLDGVCVGLRGAANLRDRDLIGVHGKGGAR